MDRVEHRPATGETARTVSYEVLARALFENYESIYDIDLETNAYNVYYESTSYRKLDLERSGGNFFRDLPAGVARVIDPRDRTYVLRMLSKPALVAGVAGGNHYSIVYRINRDGKRVYHQMRAVSQLVDGQRHILMGIRNVDASTRQKIADDKELASEQQRAGNYLEAVLATAIAYVDANLTTDEILEQSSDGTRGPAPLVRDMPSTEELSRYSSFRSWICENLVHENREKCRRTGSRDYLLECFERGEGRATVSFTIVGEDGKSLPCREVFFLYREDATDDIHALCVVYDLTQQQRRDKELEELEELRRDLHMCRIRNSTSQMKPHFLYNALGSIQEVILSDPERAAGLLEDFTIHLRGCIKAMDSDGPIPFAQELENIEAYANIEKMRFGDRLEVRFDLSCTDFPVLPLSIQPLVENAIRHGVYERGAEGGTVTLRSWSEEDEWVVQVEDTGVGFDTGEYEAKVELGDTDSTGLRNIRFRLEMIMGATMDIDSTVGTGTTVTVRIPRKEPRA